MLSRATHVRGEEQKRINAKIEAILSSNKRLYTDLISIGVARFWPRFVVLTGVHTAAFDKGVTVSEESLYKSCHLVRKTLPAIRAGCDQSLGARKEAKLFNYFLFPLLLPALTGSKRMAETYHTLMHELWGENQRLLFEQYHK